MTQRHLIGVGIGTLLLMFLVWRVGCTTSNTTSEQYTAAEVQEIIRLLREDDECRDSRTGGYFERNANSLELWEAVLGVPFERSGRATDPYWSFRTSDGVVRLQVSRYEDEIPLVFATHNGEAIGVRSNVEIDVEGLRDTVLGIKLRLDPTDSLAVSEERRQSWEQESLTLQAEQEAEQQRLEEEGHVNRELSEQRSDASAADDDYVELRDAMERGPDRDEFVAQSTEWIERRRLVITDARLQGENRRDVPLPSLDAIVWALQEDEEVPVSHSEFVAPIAEAADQGVAPQETETLQPVETPEVVSEQSGTLATQQSQQAPTQSDEPLPVQSPSDTAEEALGTRVTLTAPYPSRGGGDDSRISVQYAVIEIASQAGLEYDFDTSFDNTDPVCRRWVRPSIRNQTCRDALNSILQPVGLTYEITDGVIVLMSN